MNFCGLWINKDDKKIKDCLDTGVWYRGECPKPDSEKRKISTIEIGEKVFLYKIADDVKIKNSPFAEFLSLDEYDLNRTIVKAKAISTGVVTKTTLEELSVSVDWDKDYQPTQWYVYTRQDGIWRFDETQDEDKKLALYDIVFNHKKQDYKWWIDNGSLKRKKKNSSEGNIVFTTKNMPLNQILYGPPGTGKTYNTINKAIEIIENRTIGDDESRKKLKKSFGEYKNTGQIEFVTFHQSYGYEEFVEGIKASANDNGISYNVEEGIFKNLSERAKNIDTEKKSKYDFNNNINIWKISLGDSKNSEDDYLFQYCIENNKILLGFGEGFDFENCSDRKSIAAKLADTNKYSYPPTAIHTLKNKMKINDIVLVSYGNKKLRAIAKITDKYSLLEDDMLKTYTQSRDVEWLLIPNEPFTYDKILKKQFSQMSIYDIKSNVNIDLLRELLTQEDYLKTTKNYILIIDEINRGNISKIFGELITLIEPSKRIGADEEIRIRLPYSGDNEEPFGVPQNLYIIGTMNTADRSIAPIDTALRRRFTFEEMPPKPDLLNSDIEGIDLQKMLSAINARIEYLYDRDHTIGHSYFLGVNNLSNLKFVMKNQIIPLLAEYFYEDWENINLVLNNNGFIENKNIQKEYLLHVNKIISGKTLYEVTDDKNWEVNHFHKIYKNNIDVVEQ